jgi:hypothetical protein
MPDQKINLPKGLFNFRNKQEIYTFLICLGLSSFLWFMNALEKHYTDRISVPVKYVDFPKNKKSSERLPQKLDMTVSATGYTILQHKLRLLVSPLLLDVNELTDHNLESDYKSKYTIATNNHKEEIARQISNDMEIISIRPDSINFNVSPVINKKIKVRPVVKLTFYKQFTLKSPPFTNPDSIWVFGPQNILDTLKAVWTKPYFFEDLSHNLLRKVELNLLPELSSNTKQVLLNIPVEQYTEATFEIPIRVLNTPDSLSIKTFPGKVKVSCRLGLSDYSNITENNFMAIIDYRKISPTRSKLAVELNRFPKKVLAVDFFPKEVEYVIERKKTMKY